MLHMGNLRPFNMYPLICNNLTKIYKLSNMYTALCLEAMGKDETDIGPTSNSLTARSTKEVHNVTVIK